MRCWSHTLAPARRKALSPQGLHVREVLSAREMLYRTDRDVHRLAPARRPAWRVRRWPPLRESPVRGRGQGERVDDGERAFRVPSLSPRPCANCGVKRCAVFTRPPTWLQDRRSSRGPLSRPAPEFHHGVTSPCVSRLDYPARFGLDRSGLGEPRLLTSQAVQIAPSTSNITLPPR